MEENFIVVLIAGLFVFGVLFVASQNILPSQQPQNQIVFQEKSFGQVGSSKSAIETYQFGEFTVGEGRGNIQAYEAEKKTIKNPPLGAKPIKIEYNATAPRSGHITFEVLGKKGKGAVFIKVNGDKIWQNKLIVSGTPEINISRQNLNPGINNIKIGTTQGGILKTTNYLLEDIEVTINDRKFNDRQENFRIYQTYITNFASSTLSFKIPADGARPTKPLKISVNNDQIFNQEIVRSTQEINIEKTKLRPGYNSITFETNGNARYKLENTQFTVKFIGTVDTEKAEMNIQLNQTEKRFADKKNTLEYINFIYQPLSPTPKPVTVKVNQYKETLKPKTGFNSITLPEKTINRNNQVTFSSNSSYILNKVKLLSKKKAEK